MAEQAYSFNVATEFPGGKVNTARLSTEVQASSIITALARVDGAGGTVSGDVRTGGTVDIVFKAPLSAGDETTLHGDVTGPAGGLIAAHNNSPSNPAPLLSETGVTLSQPQPQTPGFELCNKDIRLNTCIYDGASSFEDLLVNVSTKLREPWVGEVSSGGVWKLDAGSMVACTSQTDADLNGILSIWDYRAVDQADGTTAIKYEIRGGNIDVDGNISANIFAHQIYAVAAPDLGQPNYVRLFDGYLGHKAGDTVATESPQAKMLDPAPAPGLSNVLRIYVYHPAGDKKSHVLRLLTYRPSGTF